MFIPTDSLGLWLAAAAVWVGIIVVILWLVASWISANAPAFSAAAG